jgi:hypothetical protein
LFLNKNIKGAENKIAPPITNISEGSQLSVILKKPMTFSGLVIPDIIKPMPNIIPLNREKKF